jgi:hypothetical protein
VLKPPVSRVRGKIDGTRGIVPGSGSGCRSRAVQCAADPTPSSPKAGPKPAPISIRPHHSVQNCPCTQRWMHYMGHSPKPGSGAVGSYAEDHDGRWADGWRSGGNLVRQILSRVLYVAPRHGCKTESDEVRKVSGPNMIDDYVKQTRVDHKVRTVWEHRRSRASLILISIQGRSCRARPRAALAYRAGLPGAMAHGARRCSFVGHPQPQQRAAPYMLSDTDEQVLRQKITMLLPFCSG